MRNMNKEQMKIIGILAAVALVLAGIIVVKNLMDDPDQDSTQSTSTAGTNNPGQTQAPPVTSPNEFPSWIDVQIVPVNGVGRRGIPLEGLKNIVIHYVGNPATTAQQNHDYYAQADTQVSSHFIVGLDGEIIQCVPLDEKSSATNERNKDTISIEVCHPDETGKFNDKTYDSVIRLTAWLCEQYNLTGSDVIRHYDVTGKDCPRYFVQNEDAWLRLKIDVDAQIQADKK